MRLTFSGIVNMLRPFQRTILTSLLFLAPSAFAGEGPCPSRTRDIPLRIAYVQHFKEREGRTLTLKVSVAGHFKKTPDSLHRVGCAIYAKYNNEPRWKVLIFSTYEAAEKYTPPESIENEPPEYLGACAFSGNEIECGYW